MVGHVVKIHETHTILRVEFGSGWDNTEYQMEGRGDEMKLHSSLANPIARTWRK